MKNYLKINFLVNYLRRRRWFCIIFILICTLSTIYVINFIKYHVKEEMHDTYMDDFSKNNFDYVIKNWYNFSKDDGWYNKKDISMIDSGLLNELREHWLIKYSNSNQTYYGGLLDPTVVDPSMGQAAIINEIFNNKRNGFFIECGAYDGETRSNTLMLERYFNWTGILIEADPMNFAKMLVKNRRAYLSPACLSIKSRPMKTSFLMSRNIGRIHEPENFTGSEPTNNPDVAHYGTHIVVQCFPLMSYIAAFNYPTIDYLSLDVEGNEMDILKTIPFDLVNIKTLSVEYSHVNEGRDNMIKFMENYGYYTYSFVNHPQNLANDIIFVKRNEK